MEHALTERTAAALFVVSHHTVQHGQLSLREFMRIAHSHGVPVIIDGAAEAFLVRQFLEMGADVVVFSDQKHLCGYTAGVLAGRRALIEAAALQGQGIGRAMKPTKEGVVSVIATMEWLEHLDLAPWEAEVNARTDKVVAALQGIPGITAYAEPDITGNPQTRAKIIVDPKVVGKTAAEVCEELMAGRPSIHPRAHHVDEGFFYIDPIELRDQEVPIVCERLRAILTMAQVKTAEAQSK
jgi:L-seryl-tRNA(Ser) seleniumtransferase